MSRIIHLNNNRYKVDDAICDEIVRLKSELGDRTSLIQSQARNIIDLTMANKQQSEEIDRLKKALKEIRLMPETFQQERVHFIGETLKESEVKDV